MMTLAFRSLLAAARGLLSLWLAANGLAAMAQAAAPQAVFELEPYRKTIALRAMVAGQPGLFTFDTAGGLSLLTPVFAEKVGCKPWGRLTGFQMMGDKIESPQCNGLAVTLGGRRFDAAQMAVVDIMKLLPEGAARLDGSLALDLFAGQAITIDFPARRLIVESAASLRERTARATEFPLRLSREVQGRALAASIGVPTERGPVWLELDSGNGGTVLVSKPYAALLGLDAASDKPQPVDFALGQGWRVTAPMGFTPDMIIDGNIGMPFLKDVVLTLDLGAGRLWLAR